MKGVQCKALLLVHHLHIVQNRLKNTTSFDDLLFEAQVNMGFSALLHLGEMVTNDKPALQDWWKITMRHTFQWFPHTYAFWLP